MREPDYMHAQTGAEWFNTQFRQSENPVEAILLVFLVVLLLVPRAGCGITPQQDGARADGAAVDAPKILVLPPR